MVDRLTKSLHKLSRNDREKADKVIDKLIRGDTHGLIIKKLKGAENIYRVRKGRVRVIYQLDGKNVIILDVDLRSDTTYKKY